MRQHHPGAPAHGQHVDVASGGAKTHSTQHDGTAMETQGLNINMAQHSHDDTHDGAVTQTQQQSR